MRAHVNPIKCTGYGLCSGACPEVFQLDEWGFAFVRDEQLPPAHEECARQGAGLCPERAIVIVEDEPA